jgi:hypothetical protein
VTSLVLPIGRRVEAELHVYVTWRVESSLTGRAGEMEFARALETRGLALRVLQLPRPRNTLVPFMACVPDYRSSIKHKASICRDIKLQLSC